MILMSFGDIIIAILAFIFVLGSIVLIHEGGHFYFAHKAGILCREYAFGMGPQLIHKKKGEVDYSIRAFPIGGFCAIAGEEQEQDPLKDKDKVRLVIENNIVKKICFEIDCPLFKDLPLFELKGYDLLDKEQTGKLYINVLGSDNEVVTYPVDPKALYIYANKKNVTNKDFDNKEKYIAEFQIAPYNRQLNSKSLGQRAMVMFGGPMMNFILAIFAFLIAFFIMGVSNTNSSELSGVSEGLPAYVAGLREGDVICGLELKDNPNELSIDVNKWNDISNFMQAYKDNENYEGLVTVKYYEGGNKDVVKTTDVRPMTMIYSISMIEDINSDEVKIGALAEQSIAYKSGLREGDIIKSVNGVAVDSWKDVYNEFRKVKEAKQEVSVVVDRDNEGTLEEQTFTVTPYSKRLFEKTQSVAYVDMQIGISPVTTRNPLLVIKGTFVQMWSSIKQLFNTLIMLVSSSEVGIRDLSGVVGIFSMTGDAAKSGFDNLLYWMGFLSVNVGFMNLLPIPALDGGRLLFLAIEAITRKPVSQKVQELSINITMILLFVLMGFTVINDILRLI